MPALLIIAGVGAAISAGTTIASGIKAGKGAEAQAKAQKTSLNSYAKALNARAAKIQGGFSEATRRTMATGSKLASASAAEQSRDEAERMGVVPDEQGIAEAQQAAVADIQQGVDRASSDYALAQAAERTKLELQADAVTAQAGAIDPVAARKMQVAPAIGQAGAAVGGAVSSTALAAQQPMSQVYGTTRAYDRFNALKAAGKAPDGMTFQDTKKIYSSSYDSSGRDRSGGGDK